MGEEPRKRDPHVQGDLVNPEGAHGLKTLAHALDRKPAVFRDLSSLLRERYTRELAPTRLQGKALQREQGFPGKGTECAKARR